MGEHKSSHTSKSSHHRDIMAKPSPGISNLTALLQSASTGDATIVRSPHTTLNRLRYLNEAEYVVLFTPVVPHPPATAKDMDPFEPLGRCIPPRTRHVPYLPETGMTDMHASFISSAGAIIIVLCTTENITTHDALAYHRQTKFARDIQRKINEDKSLPDLPVFILLITNGPGRQHHENGLPDFPALVTCSSYTTTALAHVAKVLFGE